MQKSCFLLLFFSFLITTSAQTDSKKQAVDAALDNWHAAAANNDFDAYFNLMTSDAVFIGTDATEHWQRKEFEEFSKPYFDRGKAWSFTPIARNVYFIDGVSYFDELINTQMGICRGSGILKNVNGNWKIAHYVLSIAVPNENVKALTELKQDWDAKFIKNKK
ncbi:hypothetical protein BST97_09750 [Nonlabens spongiae]|uniref:SnoaL-like domain-containing protein n=1 Tax=Nonlabens spongiae TaxID=331648 RepID=A0A1W6MKW1_9FLAO|nr:nuclear transport factor 2 family protein [Nonlabens spongiae]ARN78251.1 hypothetical protein BST97_09750 [Nonlabens spongiae]